MGFTRVDNWLFDVVMPNASPNAFKVVSAVVRLTVGWQQENANITFDDFHKVTGIVGRGTLNRAINEAIEKGFIDCTGSTRIKYYSIKTVLTEEQELVPEQYQEQYQNRTNVSTKIVPSSYYINKNKDKKEKKPAPKPKSKPKPPHPQWELPPSLDTPQFEAAWINWYKHLLEKNRPLTQTAGELELERLAKMGVERAIIAIDYSIRRRAVNIYEPDGADSTLQADGLATAWSEVKRVATSGNGPHFSDNRILEAVRPIWPEIKAMNNYNEREVRAKFERSYNAIT